MSLFSLLNTVRHVDHYVSGRPAGMKEQPPAAMASTEDSLAIAIEELKNREKDIESLKIKLGKSEELEAKLSEKEPSFHRLKDEVNMNDDSSSSKVAFQAFMADDKLGRLESELQSTKEQLSRAQENEQASSLKAENLAEEASYLKHELKSITDAEENNKKAMDDLALALNELQETENMNKKAKKENQKLRNIMKQAINEANVAKEASNIARAENSQLKDAIAKKDEALDFLSQENETLEIKEAAARDIIKEMKMFCELGNGGVCNVR
ncbi:hypothetical protein F3Y22_tig00113124pilonHSYRG00166 [Hibiscus syriacus]|uniref:Uncharacterized protein n=1 Tax=Hibiscus syriacus TaxID=106335 RepID=A0A6A2WPV5_HIBSY|nr:hypothetical protein F3Y22_tig00113124pilonHSYRG00166 [Hibiscus syriacus]